MGCGGSSNKDTAKPGAKPDGKKPDFGADCKSLLSKYLTDDVWNKLKDEKDQFGFTFQQLINSGVVNKDSGIGVYAGSADSYSKFAPLMDPIIEQYHGHKAGDKHVSDWDVSKCDDMEDFDPDNKYCVSTRIRVARNLDGFLLGTGISKEDRAKVEAAAKEAFDKMEGELKGTYYPLKELSEEKTKELIEGHYLFKQGDRFLEACGLNRDWPESRGIYYNENFTFLVWVNEEDQFRIISMQKGGNIKEVFTRLAKAQEEIEKIKKFAYNDHLGYITTCPTNLGTGLRASIHVKVPNLCKDKERFQKIADDNHVQIRGIHGEHSESNDGTYDVSNKRRLGFSEIQLVHDMYNGVKAMVEAEKSLEGGEKQEEQPAEEKAEGEAE